MSDILYALISIICAIMLEILLNRTLRLKSEDTSDKAFMTLLVVSFAFCIVDAFWGLCDSGTLKLSNFIFSALTFMIYFHDLFTAKIGWLTTRYDCNVYNF